MPRPTNTPATAPPTSELKGVDEDGDTLTAHHIRPWNQIVDLLNDGLADPAGRKLIVANGKQAADDAMDSSAPP